MAWNVDGLKFLYKEIEEVRDELEQEAKDESKRKNYGHAYMLSSQAYGLTTALNWIVKVDREIDSYRNIEKIDKDAEEQAKKCEKCLEESEKEEVDSNSSHN